MTLQLTEDLSRRYSLAKVYSRHFGAFHSDLPLLFKTKHASSTNGLLIQLPSLFHLAGSLMLHNNVLSNNKRFSAHIFKLPSLRSHFDDIEEASGATTNLGTDRFPPVAHQNVIFNILDGILNVTLDIPSLSKINCDSGLVPAVEPTVRVELCRRILDWLDSSVTNLKEPCVLKASKVECDTILAILRAIAFVMETDPEFTTRTRGIYAQLANVVAAIVLHRYSVSVMLSISLDLLKTKAKRETPVRKLVEEMHSTMLAWDTYEEMSMRNAFEVSFLKAINTV